MNNDASLRDRATHEPSPDGLGHSVGIPSAHTPGPWRVRHWSKAKSVIVAGANSHVCGPAINADAVLIAAAPELFEALQDAIEIMDDQLGGDFPDSLRHFKAVLAKAGAA